MFVEVILWRLMLGPENDYYSSISSYYGFGGSLRLAFVIFVVLGILFGWILANDISTVLENMPKEY